MLKRLLSPRRGEGKKKRGAVCGATAGGAGATEPLPAAAPQPALLPPQQATVGALQKLGEVEDSLTKRRELIELKVAAETARAREFARQGNTSAALACLRKRKLFESQLEAVETSLLRLSEQQLGLEGVQATAQTAAALKAGAAAGAAAMAGMSVETVDALREEAAEAAANLSAVQATLGMPVGQGAELDQDELEAELAELEAAQQEEEQIARAPAAIPALPALAPQQAPQQAQQAQQAVQAQASLAPPDTPTHRPQPAARQLSEREHREQTAEMAA